MQKPSFWRLWIAYSIDLLVLVPIEVVFWKIITWTGIFTSPSILQSLISISIVVLYFAVLNTIWGKTIGARILSFSLPVNLQQKASFGRTFISYGWKWLLTYVLIGGMFSLLGIGGMMVPSFVILGCFSLTLAILEQFSINRSIRNSLVTDSLGNCPAAFWRLCGAYGMDFLVTFLMVWGLWVLLSVHTSITGGDLGMLGLPAFLAFTINTLYFVGCEYIWHKTLGKKCFHLQAIAKKNWSFLRVFVAYGIDFALLIPGELSFLVAGFMTLYLFMFGNVPNWVTFGGLALFVGIVLLYFSILEGLFGKTLGKKLMGLQVVQVTPQKQKEETK